MFNNMMQPGSPAFWMGNQAPGQDLQITRAALVEIQKADLGRKFAKIDRRPLDPPPVALLKLYTRDGDGEKEVDPSKQTVSVGRLCTVDLFPASISEYNAAMAAEQSSNPPYDSTEDNTVVQTVNGQAITESMKLTRFLVGQKQAQPTVMDWDGSKCLMFVFNDLSVKLEGNFFLRYRTFDIFPGGQSHPAQAEFCGGSFRVYSTKEFPGLNPSTELTKELALRGVRVNVRESERKRRRREDSDP